MSVFHKKSFFAFNGKSPFEKLRTLFAELRLQLGNLNFPFFIPDRDYKKGLRMIEESKLILSASSPGHGSAVEEIEIDYKDEGAEIGFNATYLMDIMRQIEGGNVQVSFFDSASPTILREVGDGSAIFVLMPMRV